MDISSIIKRCIKGNADAQKHLYSLYSGKMMTVCHRYTKNVHDAHDVFQEGFLKVFENISQLKNEGMIEWWMKKIFVNESLKLYNKNKSIEAEEESFFLSPKLSEDADVYSKLSTDEITLKIKKLPTKMRLVFNLYVIEGFSHKEISEMLDISVGTSKSNLHDARVALKNELLSENESIKNIR